MKHWTIILMAVLMTASMPLGARAQSVADPDSKAIHWDQKVLEHKAKIGDKETEFTFHLTNTSNEEVVIKRVRTSCGCTVAKLPDQPWHLAPREEGDIEVAVNLLGRIGTVMKSVFVDTSEGMHVLTVKVVIPGGQGRKMSGLTQRQRNQLIALRDRQAVFRGKCAACHSDPAGNLTGKELYDAVCGVCHDAHNRASMVPDLWKLDIPTSLEYWQQWIAHGQPGTLMPAFLNTQGGPLTKEQVKSLAVYLEDTVNAPKTENDPLDELLPDVFPAGTENHSDSPPLIPITEN